MAITNEELIELLRLENWPEPLRQRFLDQLTPEKRAVYEKMQEVMLWINGKGPRPPGVLVD
jgi:hypothetical protein